MITSRDVIQADNSLAVSQAQASASDVAQPMTIYYLAWRLRPNHPWQSEEHSNRFEAHGRYLRLLERGLEVYLEARRRAM